MISDWPVYQEAWVFPEAEKAVESFKEAIRGIRNTRTEMNVPMNRKTHLYVVGKDAETCARYEACKKSFVNLAFAKEIHVQENKDGIGEDAVSVVVSDAVVYMPLEDLVDREKEMERLKKEQERLTKEIARCQGMLNNPNFVNKAPEAKVLEEKEKLAKYEQMMQQVEAACAKAGVQVMGGHTEITAVVNQPVISVCGVGKVKDGCLISTGGAKPGMDILVAKWIGIEGTSIIAKEKEKDLLTRFSAPFIENAKKLDVYLSVLSEAAVAVRSGVSAMHDVTEGGIFGALWEMAEASGVGLEIDLKKIPVRQETIEICEFFGINPYELISSGSMLMAAADGNLLVNELKKAGIPATIIGKATAGNDRVLLNEEERRFLEPPKTDELYKVV